MTDEKKIIKEARREIANSLKVQENQTSSEN